jgi:hypothetical protein
MEWFRWYLNPDRRLFDFLDQAFQKFHPGHENEFPSEVLWWVQGRRARIETILPTSRKGSDLKEVHDMMQFLDEEWKPVTYFLLHWFLRTWAKALSDTSIVSAHSVEPESSSRTGFFKWLRWLRATLGNPLPVVERTLYSLSEVIGVNEVRLPILSRRLIRDYEFFVEEPEWWVDHSWDRQ